jgi:hypothetical protein
MPPVHLPLSICECPWPADEWDFLVAQTRAAIEEEGLPEETTQHAVARIRVRQRGDKGPMEHHHIAEHTDAPSGDHCSNSRRRRTPPSGKQGLHTVP